MEGALTQMTNFVIALKDKVDTGGGGAAPQAISQGSFALRSDLLTHMRTVWVCLDGFLSGNERGPVGVRGAQLSGS